MHRGRYYAVSLGVGGTELGLLMTAYAAAEVPSSIDEAMLSFTMHANQSGVKGNDSTVCVSITTHI